MPVCYQQSPNSMLWNRNKQMTDFIILCGTKFVLVTIKKERTTQERRWKQNEADSPNRSMMRMRNSYTSKQEYYLNMHIRIYRLQVPKHFTVCNILI